MYFRKLIPYIISFVLKSSVYLVVIFHHCKFPLLLILSKICLRNILFVDKVIDLEWVS